MAFSTVLASRVGFLWHSHTGGESWCHPCLVQVNSTPIFHCHGPKWLLARYWHWGWMSCDTCTPGGEAWCHPWLVQVNSTPIFHCHGPKWLLARYWHWGWVSCDTRTRGGSLVSSLSCSSQQYSNLSLPWSEMAFSTVLALRVGFLWHSYTGGGAWYHPCLVQVNSTPIFHCHGPKWLLARYWHWGWMSCDTCTPGGEAWCHPWLVQVNSTPIFHCHGPKWLLARYWHWGWVSCDTRTRGGSLVSSLSCSSQQYSNLSLPWSEMAFSTVFALRVDVLWHLHTGGGSLVSSLACSSQQYSNLSLSWSEMAFSTVLALRVGFLWHSYTGGEAWYHPCLVQVNSTPIFHCHGPKWLLARYWHWGWMSCDTCTPGGEAWCHPWLVQVNSTPIFHCHGPKWLLARYWHWGWVSCDTRTRGGSLVSSLSCSSQQYSNLSLSWSEMAFSTVLALRVGFLWHSYTGGGAWYHPCLVQVNSTPIFHCHGPKWLLARYWHWGWMSCDTCTPGGEAWCHPWLVQVNSTPIFHCHGPKWLLARYWHWGWVSCDTRTRGGSLVSSLSCSSQQYSNLSLPWSEMAFSTVFALRVDVLWHLHTGGGSLVSSLACSSQQYSNLSLSWSEMAFSTVLALRVGFLWHSYTGGGAWYHPCLVQVNSTPIFHCHGPKWLLARYLHWGWVRFLG